MGNQRDCFNCLWGNIWIDPEKLIHFETVKVKKGQVWEHQRQFTPFGDDEGLSCL